MVARRRLAGCTIALLCVAALLPVTGRAADSGKSDIATVVAQAIRPMMQRYSIPGMAVGIVMGRYSRVYDFGVTSRATASPVTGDTLFEIGSVSKTFTATLACYAQVDGKLSLSDVASKYLPSLRDSSFAKVSLVTLGTHTSGGLPLQVPAGIATNAQLMAWFRNWQPTYPPGTYRTYGNPGVGLLGMIAAKSLQGNFASLLQTKLFPGLGMTRAYLDVPESQMGNYAQGYTATGTPVRMTPGVLAAETYGIRTTAGDMLRFVEANMRMLPLDDRLQSAITETHTGYYQVGAMTQDLVWEQYRYPVGLDVLLAGNSARMGLEPNPAARLDPPLQPLDDVLIDKTGSTNGFAAYVAFVPVRQIGVVLLANKNYPIEARVTAAYDILRRLDGDLNLLDGDTPQE